MYTGCGKVRACIFGLALLVLPCFAQAQAGVSSNEWRNVVHNRLPLYGDRNWIVVSDSAFPVYSEPGIETIVVDEDLPKVLEYVANAISSSPHVRATVFLDKELQFVDERDYPGVSQLRKQIAGDFVNNQVSSIPHAEVLQRINEAGKTFRILFIKTTERIPYSSVYMRLDCGYLTDAVQRKIENAMLAAGESQPKR